MQIIGISSATGISADQIWVSIISTEESTVYFSETQRSSTILISTEVATQLILPDLRGIMFRNLQAEGLIMSRSGITTGQDLR